MELFKQNEIDDLVAIATAGVQKLEAEPSLFASLFCLQLTDLLRLLLQITNRADVQKMLDRVIAVIHANRPSETALKQRITKWRKAPK